MKSLLIASTAAVLILAGLSAEASDYQLTLQDHRFSPDKIVLPAHQKIKLTVTNLQPSPAEFESEELDREKVVGAHKSIVVLLGPLEPGSYSYVDDFHRESKGSIIVK